MDFITLNKDTIESEHICCAFSDKKCSHGYNLKKEWLKDQFDHDYTFYRLDERAKVFIEYGPAESAWIPITANNFLNINCFWVSGKYKKQGLGKKLLEKALKDAADSNKDGLVTVVGKKKFHFMSDGKWLKKQGFEECDRTDSGFILLAKFLNEVKEKPRFNPEAIRGECEDNNGLVAYYSNRCPFTEYHVHTSLVETTSKRNLPLNIIKIDTLEEAKSCPTPATIFSLFYKGKFLTTDISVCSDSRFDKFAQNLYSPI